MQDEPTSYERFARSMLLPVTFECCDSEHDGDDPLTIDPHFDVLNWVRYGSGWGTIWISRIGGDSKNGYEYTCSQCVDLHNFREALRKAEEAIREDRIQMVEDAADAIADEYWLHLCQTLELGGDFRPQ